jgi:hypothetical protein
MSGLDLARCVSVCLNFARWDRPRFTRRGRLQKRFVLVFIAVCAGSARRDFADLENRQRRKSFVGSKLTPFAFFCEKTQRVSERGCPDRRSQRRWMKRVAPGERGPQTLVCSGSRGPEAPARQRLSVRTPEQPNPASPRSRLSKQAKDTHGKRPSVENITS